MLFLPYRWHMLCIYLTYVQPNSAGPNTPNRLSSINGRICQIDVNAGEMCGHIFNSQPALRRHLRNNHPGASM